MRQFIASNTDAVLLHACHHTLRLTLQQLRAVALRVLSGYTVQLSRASSAATAAALAAAAAATTEAALNASGRRRSSVSAARKQSLSISSNGTSISSSCSTEVSWSQLA
jgi:hypothetical protein